MQAIQQENKHRVPLALNEKKKKKKLESQENCSLTSSLGGKFETLMFSLPNIHRES